MRSGFCGTLKCWQDGLASLMLSFFLCRDWLCDGDFGQVVCLAKLS